jgi:hypothetical protein
LLPAGQQLSKQAVLQLLQAAIQHGNKCMLRGLCRLKIARQLDDEVMQQVQAALSLPAATSAHTSCSDVSAVERLNPAVG